MSSPIGSFLCPEGFAGPSGLRALSREGSAMLEAARLARSRTSHGRPGRRPYAELTALRAREPVVLVPGFMAGDTSLALMNRFLRRQDFRTYRAGIHANVGCTREVAQTLERRIEAIAIRRESKVSLVGHSLGGMLARGLAFRRPDLVAGIVTMGSPMLAPGAVHRILKWDLEVLVQLSHLGVPGLMTKDCISGRCASDSWSDARTPLADSVGFTAIFSRRDGIVDWRGCVDPQAVAVEVTTSHLGMAVDPLVFDHVHAALDRYRLNQASPETVPHASAG